MERKESEHLSFSEGKGIKLDDLCMGSVMFFSNVLVKKMILQSSITLTV